MNVPKSYQKNIFKFKTIEKWNCEYPTINKGDITKTFFPTISERLKKKAFGTHFSYCAISLRAWNFKRFSRAFHAGIIKSVFLQSRSSTERFPLVF